MIIIVYRPEGGSEQGENDWYLAEQESLHPSQPKGRRWVQTNSVAKFFEEPNTAAREYERICQWVQDGMPPGRHMPQRLPGPGTIYALTVRIERPLSGYRFKMASSQ